MAKKTKKETTKQVSKKEQLIQEHQELNRQFIALMGKADVTMIAMRMCAIESELLLEYGYDLFSDEY